MENFTFERLGIAHKEGVIDIFNYYVKETTAAYREKTVGYDHFLNFLEDCKDYSGYAIKSPRDEIIGVCWIEPYKAISTFKETAEVTYFIHKDYTGKGIGTLALEKLQDDARKMGVKKLFVEISSANAGSIHFHQKNGFVECGILKNVGKKFGEYFSVVLMIKDI